MAAVGQVSTSVHVWDQLLSSLAWRDKGRRLHFSKSHQGNQSMEYKGLFGVSGLQEESLEPFEKGWVSTAFADRGGVISYRFSMAVWKMLAQEGWMPEVKKIQHISYFFFSCVL